MTKHIEHRIFYSHSPKAVWEYLTKAELIAQWLMPNDFLPVIGHEFRFTTKPMPQFDLDGIFYCKVLEIVPFKKLVYTWTSGPGNGTFTVDSVVEWELIAKDNGTELLLKHSGRMENADVYTAMHKGWLGNMNKMDNLLNTAA